MNNKTLAFVTKLRRLESQIRAARLADYAYKDGELALAILYQKTGELISLIEHESEQFSEQIRNAVLRDANFFIMRATQIVGIIVRSTSVRNAFELYIPFLRICQHILGEDANLILSSEWQYIPFTYPQNLADLPNFVIIGMPASELDNVLVFPAAGHELGHSIWKKRGLKGIVAPLIKAGIDGTFLAKRGELEEVFTIAKGADLDQDMFVQYIKSQVHTYTLAQLEEFFSDFIGLLLFGEGYLLAFEYLVAPQLSGSRSWEYPETRHRAAILREYAKEPSEIDSKVYSKQFIPEQMPVSIQSAKIFSFADEIADQILPNIYSMAEQIIGGAGVATPNPELINIVQSVFASGVPFDGEASIGDLINAVWRIFRSDQRSASPGRRQEEILSDLVMKSVEIHEIRAYLP